MNSIVLYSVILFAALVQWGYMRFVLSRGYSASFMKVRRTQNLERLFNEHKAILYAKAVFILICILMIAASIKMLLDLLGLHDWVAKSVSTAILILFSKDLIYFHLVKFVLERESTE